MDIKEAFKHLENMPFDRRIEAAIDDLDTIISDSKEGWPIEVEDIKDVISCLQQILEINNAIKASVVDTALLQPTAG